MSKEGTEHATTVDTQKLTQPLEVAGSTKNTTNPQSRFRNSTIDFDLNIKNVILVASCIKLDLRFLLFNILSHRRILEDAKELWLPAI